MITRAGHGARKSTVSERPLSSC